MGRPRRIPGAESGILELGQPEGVRPPGALAPQAHEVDDAHPDPRPGNRLERRPQICDTPAGNREAVDQEAEQEGADQPAEEGTDDAAPIVVRKPYGEVPEGQA